MTVLVDTTIWSLALRRRAEQLSLEEKRLVENWAELVTSGRAALIGPVLQEVLSGIRSVEVFEALLKKLLSFHDLAILPGDHVQAARFFNACRSHGIAGPHVDMLICAAAYRHKVPIFTTDPDFSATPGTCRSVCTIPSSRSRGSLPSAPAFGYLGPLEVAPCAGTSRPSTTSSRR